MQGRRIRAAGLSPLGGIRPSLVVIHAPAGFGKTVLLQGLAEGRARVDRIDCRAADAFARAERWDGAGTAALALDEPERLPEPLRTRLIERALAAASGEAPLLLATRRVAALPLARRLASDRTIVMRADRLPFTRTEMGELCARRIPRSQIDGLYAATLGWPAAVMLLLRWLEAGGRIDGSGAWLHQSGMLDYVRQEVVAELPPTLAETLMLAGLGDGMAPAMIDALDPARALGGRFAALAGMVPGLVSLEEGCCRLHPLLATTAADAFAERPAEERIAMLRRGADWLGARGALAEAARMAVRAGVPERIVGYVHAAGGLRLWLDGKIEMIGDLFSIAGEGLAAGDARLGLLRCVRLLKEGRTAAAERLFATIAADLPDDPVVRQEALVLRSALLVYGCQVDGPVDLRSIDAPDVDAAWGSMWPTLRLVANAQAGDIDLARACLDQARAESTDTGFTYNLIFLDVHEAEIEIARAGLVEARRALDRARRRWRRGYPGDHGLETVIAATTALLEFECGRTVAARNQLRIVAGSPAEMEAWLDTYLAVYEPRFRLLAAEQGLSVALPAIDAACRTLGERGLDRIARLLRALATAIAGERALADPATPLPAPPEPPARLEDLRSWQEREHLWLAAAYRDLADGRADAAVARLVELRGHARDRGLRRTELRAALLLVAACDRAGRPQDADEAFAHAISLGTETGSRRAFAEFGGPSVADRLRRGDHAGLSQHAWPRPPRSTAGEVALLTARQRQILDALRQGGSDKMLGRQLGLSEHGVRFHLKKMFRTFGVHDRVALIAAAERATT